MRNTLTQIFAVLLILISITTAAAWEFYFDDRINTVSVLQATLSLPRGHKVTPSDFAPLRVKVNAVPEGAVTNIDLIKNCETLIPVSKGMIMVKDFFDKAEIAPDNNQMITPVPDQWIYSLPGSLRRKDIVSLYEYPAGNQLSSHGYNEYPLVVKRLPQTASILSGEPILKNIVVAFAKDSANQEVKPSDEKRQRIDATGNISKLELILTAEQFKLLETKALNGYKFIFTYR